MKTVVMIRERKSENQVFENTFFVEDHVTDPERAFRLAVEAYLKTPEGKQKIVKACSDYNWGDAMATLPEEILNQYGIHTGPDVTYICVNQDEVLFPELQEEFEDEDEFEEE